MVYGYLIKSIGWGYAMVRGSRRVVYPFAAQD
jgi:hypothetical protein